MKFFGRSPSRSEHAVTVTDAAAEAIGRITAEQQLDKKTLSLVVARGEEGQWALDLSEDAADQNSPQNAVATSNGVVVVVPRNLVEEFKDLVIDFEHGGFRPRGSAAPNPSASDPGRIELAADKLFLLSPELENDRDAVERIKWYLWDGDSRAAVVMSIDPLVIAAYTDEFDAVALLAFPPELVKRYALKPGYKMLTVNTYELGEGSASDLEKVESFGSRYRNFTPLIAEFLTRDATRVNERKRQIPREEFDRANLLGERAMKRAATRYRNGRPPHSGTPAW